MIQLALCGFGQPSRVVIINRDTGSAPTIFELNSGAAAFSRPTDNPSDCLLYAVMDRAAGTLPPNGRRQPAPIPFLKGLR